jgi:NAD(P)H-dependent flavin oxidoreductase YrpB (nitropropane dioxygenase family)
MVVKILHASGIVVANMVGYPGHTVKEMESGADLIIAQGTEAGGHTVYFATSASIPSQPQ